jgi:hypothetical protein
MEDIVAAGRRFGPTRVGVQIGAEQRHAVSRLAGAALAQHGAHVARPLEVADRRADVVASGQ